MKNQQEKRVTASVALFSFGGVSRPEIALHKK